MTIAGELRSLVSPSQQNLSDAPRITERAPNTEALKIEHGKAAIITFLRHCGCPFAEKTFLELRFLAHSHQNMRFIAISHSSQKDTDEWLASLPKNHSKDQPQNLKVHVDEQREVYAAWGLGLSSYWEVISPWAIAGAVKLGREKGIWNRPTGSGTRLQKAGSFAVDQHGKIAWCHVSTQADDVSDLSGGMKALEK